MSTEKCVQEGARCATRRRKWLNWLREGRRPMEHHGSNSLLNPGHTRVDNTQTLTCSHCPAVFTNLDDKNVSHSNSEIVHPKERSRPPSRRVRDLYMPGVCVTVVDTEKLGDDDFQVSWETNSAQFPCVPLIVVWDTQSSARIGNVNDTMARVAHVVRVRTNAVPDKRQQAYERLRARIEETLSRLIRGASAPRLIGTAFLTPSHVPTTSTPVSFVGRGEDCLHMAVYLIDAGHPVRVVVAICDKHALYGVQASLTSSIHRLIDRKVNVHIWVDLEVPSIACSVINAAEQMYPGQFKDRVYNFGHRIGCEGRVAVARAEFLTLCVFERPIATSRSRDRVSILHQAIVDGGIDVSLGLGTRSTSGARLRRTPPQPAGASDASQHVAPFPTAWAFALIIAAVAMVALLCVFCVRAALTRSART